MGGGKSGRERERRIRGRKSVRNSKEGFEGENDGEGEGEGGRRERAKRERRLCVRVRLREVSVRRMCPGLPGVRMGRWTWKWKWVYP